MLKRYLEIKDEIKALNDEKLDIEKSIYIEHQDVLNGIEEGSKSFKTDGFKISVTKKLTYSVDQAMADAMQIGFKRKYELDKKAYKDLTDSEKKSVDDCLTTKSAKPSFSVEAL